MGGLTALSPLLDRRSRASDGPAVPLLLCDWGCAISSEIDLVDGQIWGRDPNSWAEGVSAWSRST
jgi:hypothetical protein